MTKYLLMLIIGGMVALLGCRPAAEPLAAPTVTPQNSPQSLPTLTPTVPPGTIANPTAVPDMTNSTLTIVATAGPTCPGPARPGQNCTRPYQGDFVVLRSDGSEAAQVSTDANGRATVNLPPGDYTVSVKLVPGTKLPRADKVGVSVSAGQAAEVTIELDTGIR